MKRKNSQYPRQLTPREREWLEWILPSNRTGYRQYRELIDKMTVLGEGRRGKGDMILGISGDVPDTDSPLPPVFSYGVIETDLGQITITLREIVSDQIGVEIVGQRTEEVPEEFEESRRWTYSTWNPGNVCPQCQRAAREIPMYTQENKHFVLVLCSGDRRLWVYDGETQANHLIPVTNLHNELMMHKKIRDPNIALDSKRLFTDLAKYTDADLSYAFLTYNKLKTKVEVRGALIASRKENATFGQKLKRIFSIEKQR